MAEESVKIEVFGISTETVEDDRSDSVEIKQQREFDLIAEGDGEPVKVVSKDVELETSEAPEPVKEILKDVELESSEAPDLMKDVESENSEAPEPVKVVLKDVELESSEAPEPVKVDLKDVELENSELPAGQDGGVTNEGAGGAEQRTEGVTDDTESPVLEEEEQEECGFCLFMKGGPCGERFTIWQSCVDAAEKSSEDIVEKCAQTTSLLKVCMEMNLEYYGPVLEAEKAMEEVASQDENQAEGTA